MSAVGGVNSAAPSWEGALAVNDPARKLPKAPSKDSRSHRKRKNYDPTSKFFKDLEEENRKNGKHVAKQRMCLRCQKMMDSTWSGDRFHYKCRATNQGQTGLD